MDIDFGEYNLSSAKDRICKEKVCELLSKTYWANKRSREIIMKSIENSICIGIYKNTKMVGFARIVTDYATMYWLCDVVIDEEFRGKGLGKKLIECIIEMDEIKGMYGILSTRDAQKLYAQYGFEGASENSFMHKV